MNSTAELIRDYGGASPSQPPSKTTQLGDDYQEELVDERVANEDRFEAPATAERHINRHQSTFVTSIASILRPWVRVAEWDGYVTEIGQSSFGAVLRGVAGDGVAGESHDAEIALADVGPSDKALLRLGAFFRVCIYFQLDDDDRPKRYAKVVFRRLPAYRQAELEDADLRSEERHRRLRVE